VRTDLFEFALEILNAGRDQAPVNLQLGLTRAAQTHAAHAAGPSAAAARLAGKVRPGPGQPGQTIFILGQFNLEPAFAGLGVLRKDIQNQSRPVDHPNRLAKSSLQFTLVPGREFVIKNDHVRV
jgi:hypothetical protein